MRLNSRGISLKSAQIVHSKLTYLHPVLHDLPEVISDQPQRRLASESFSSLDFDELVKLLREPTRAVHLYVTRRLVPALSARLIGVKADGARIDFGDHGLSAIIDAEGKRRPLSKKWTATHGDSATIDLEIYKVPPAQTTSTWLRDASLSYAWPRLRDEWLLEQPNGNEALQFHP